MNSSDTTALADWLQPMLASVAPAARGALAAKIARTLRQQTQASMRAQTAPDGTPWEKRRARIVLANGPRAGAARARQRRGPMMVKMRQARYLPTQSSADAATLTFAGRVLRIARVHHFGLPDQVAPGGPTHVYAERPLIGLADAQVDQIKAVVLAHLLAAAHQKK